VDLFVRACIRAMMGAVTDVAAVFGDDYLYFYEDCIDDWHSDRDTAEILGLLEVGRGARILDVPCGQGRITRRLAAAGMDVTGVDLVAAYVETARATPAHPDGRATYVVGDMKELPVPGPFDAVVCWYSSFGYDDDGGCQAALAEFRRVLRPGGTLLIETMHHDGAVRNLTPAPDASAITRGDDVLVDVARFDTVAGRLRTDRTVYRSGTVRRVSFSVRLPTPPEWERWLRDAGFERVEYFAGGGGALEYDSWVVVVRATA